MASKSSDSTKVSTDPAKITELLTRGVAEVYPNRDVLRAVLMSGKRLRIYNGIDPTAPTLHIGHLASLQKLRQFQELGHEVIMLIGDFTGMIGDPSGKLGTRKQLTRERVNENAKAYREQASAVLSFTGKNAAKIRRNSEWWDVMSARRLLELCAFITERRLIERDMFQERIKSGEEITVLEFLYPILQAYDSVEMAVDVEVGGTDQTFNMLKGREYVKKLQGREKFVITVPLLADASGKKIGKTEGNMVELGATPEDLFGQAMALPDGVITACFEQCTSALIAKVEEVRKRLVSGENPRDLKMELACEFVRMRYGAAAAAKARAAFVKTFQKHETPDAIPTIRPREFGGREIRAAVTLVDFLVHPKVRLASSKSEARRVIAQHGVAVDGVVIDDPTFQVLVGIPNGGRIIQKGKRYFVRVVST